MCSAAMDTQQDINSYQGRWMVLAQSRKRKALLAAGASIMLEHEYKMPRLSLSKLKVISVPSKKVTSVQ
jgi:hypothetical protein